MTEGFFGIIIAIVGMLIYDNVVKFKSSVQSGKSVRPRAAAATASKAKTATKTAAKPAKKPAPKPAKKPASPKPKKAPAAKPTAAKKPRAKKA